MNRRPPGLFILPAVAGLLTTIYAWQPQIDEKMAEEKKAKKEAEIAKVKEARARRRAIPSTRNNEANNNIVQQEQLQDAVTSEEKKE